MGARMRAHDWRATAIADPSAWHPSLRTLVGIMLGAVQPMFVAWGEARTLLYNDTYAPMLGRKHPQALGRPFFDVWPEVLGEVGPLFGQVFAGQPVHMDDIELWLERHGRLEEAHFAFGYTPVRDETGKVLGLFCSCTETTAQVTAERQRAAAIERQRRLFQQAPGFICIMGGPGHVYEFVNDAQRRLFGERDWIGNSVREVFPDLEGQGFFELLDGVYSSGRRHVAHGARARVRTSPDGPEEELFLDFIYEPVVDEHGQVTGIFCEGFDVTETHRATAALRQSEARLLEVNADLERRVIARAQARGMAWQVSPDLMGALNSRGFFETSNPAWQTVLGWSEAEVASMPIFDLLHPDDLERTREGFEMTQRGQPAVRFPNRYRCKDGSYRWISWFAIPEDGLVYCTGRDITAEREQAEALARAEEALRQSQKMEAIGQLTGGLAHDFNNLLTGISGSLELLQTRVSQGRISELDRYVAAAQGGAKRAAALTHRLLAFSRRQTLEPKPTNVNRLVVGMEELIRRTVGPAIALEVVGVAGPWRTLVDPGQLESALLNLCINARDAMPGGGRITIETANTWMDERGAGERDMAPGQYLSLCVTDNGTGMAPEVAARAFEPFYTTKPLGQGTGLGLSMVYGFARQSGGQVRIYSEPGNGTTVCIYLPRFQGTDDGEEAALPVPVAARGMVGATVLVVDDEAMVRLLVSEVVQDLGLAAVEAADGAAGLRILQSDTRIDLLVTDVGLPGGVNGRQVADAGRVTRPGLKVLFITGYAENAVFGNGQLEPGMQVLTKPFAMDALADRVRTLISS
jgi:PAS domain S-box-containing protein